MAVSELAATATAAALSARRHALKHRLPLAMPVATAAVVAVAANSDTAGDVWHAWPEKRNGVAGQSNW